MSNNTKIFSEAIAEAKAIRETAMANAKLALEEAFAPRIQEMMSDKLEALAEEDEMEEGYEKEMEEGNMDEISLEELLSELEGLEESADNDADDQMDENTISEAEAEDEVGTISVDELKDIIRDIMADVMGGEEGEEEAGEEEMEAGEEEMEAGEDDLELEEILAEIASLEEGDDEIEEGLKDFAQKVGDKVKATVGTGGKMDQFIDRTHAKMKKAGVTSPYGANTNGLQEEEELDEMGNSTMREPSDSAAAGLDNIISGLKKLVAKGGPIAAKAKAALEDLGSAAGAAMRAEAKELEEAMNTIATLRSELNEVNLLNAKLLYVNKLFKAKNLNESQKVKVINAFDRAETVREAKNVFDTLSESLNTEKAKSQIKESLSFASKSAGVSDRQPIMEGNDFMLRMQKLAGII
jgi:hypothetical protein